jgi:hypothetical protein
MMNITLENISHKITDINIDEHGTVTGTIVLLNTPKGQIAQAIVEGGLPLFISSRATGNVDSKTGAVTLEHISTYDLVGSPGFSQARLHLNENQIVESIDDNTYFIINNNEINENTTDMNIEELVKKFEILENRIAELEEANAELREALDEKENVDIEALANGIQAWIVEEFAPEHESEIMESVNDKLNNIVEGVQNWVVEEFAPEVQNWVVEEFAPEVENWVVEEFAPEVENWIVEEFAPEVQNWIVEEYSPEVQNWIVEEYSPEVESWIKESYEPELIDTVTENINENKKSNLDAIDETLQLLESLEVSKPTYSKKAIITENADEPYFVQEMPAETRVKWDLASQDVKESIMRRAKLYNLTNEGAIERFWQNINFEEIKPSAVYESIQSVEDEHERRIRQQLRSWKNKQLMF